MQVLDRRVTPEEDGVLRRLHCLEHLGARLAPPLLVLKAEIRARDRRLEIREPLDEHVAQTIWIT